MIPLGNPDRTLSKKGREHLAKRPAGADLWQYQPEAPIGRPGYHSRCSHQDDANFQQTCFCPTLSSPIPSLNLLDQDPHLLGGSNDIVKCFKGGQADGGEPSRQRLA